MSEELGINVRVMSEELSRNFRVMSKELSRKTPHSSLSEAVPTAIS